MNIQLDSSVQARPGFFTAGLDFINRQQQDWKVTVVRTSLDKFAYQMLFPYLSIYIVALGATGTQLGLVNSVGMTSAGAVSLLVGWLIDRTGSGVLLRIIGRPFLPAFIASFMRAAF